jgi:hypothetical protein
MPDAFFRFLSIQPNYEEPAPGRSEQLTIRQFCSTGCARDFLATVVPPLSPREQAAIAENNKKVDEKNAAKTATVPTPFNNIDTNTPQ